MYPRNAASPERISIGAVVQISDGAVQTAGVTVRVLPAGGTEADGVGTVAYSTDGVVLYTPTQAETNYTSFVLIAKKTGCIPASVTVVTSESTVSGRVYVATNGDKTGYTATVSDKTGFSLAPTTGLGNQTASITGNLTGSVGSVTGAVGSVTSFGTLVSDIATAVWSAATRTLTAFGFNVNLTPSTGLGAQSGSVALVTKVDELGVNALTANGAVDAIPTAVWNALTTTTWVTDSFGRHILISNNNNRSVQVTGGGSGHIAADIHALQAGVITSAAFSANWLTAAGLAADAATEIATAVAATQALSRLDSMIESDGAGQFRFDTIALEMAPAGGGGGGTDWTANERTAIRAILGVPTSGTTPTDPTSGILDTIRDSLPGTQTINVYPVSASTPERVAGTTLTFYRDESRSVSVATDFTLTNLTLQFTVEDQDGNDVYTLANALITRSGQTFTIPITTAVTGGLGQYRWSMRDITGGGNSVIGMGVLTVQEAANNG
jgi:hypothetical protein